MTALATLPVAMQVVMKRLCFLISHVQMLTDVYGPSIFPARPDDGYRRLNGPHHPRRHQPGSRRALKSGYGRPALVAEPTDWIWTFVPVCGAAMIRPPPM